MPSNRLHLDFSLNTAEERTQFLNTYLERTEFINKPPTHEELEMMGNYLLWGQDENGKNTVQNKLVQIDTRNGTWDKKDDESLDELLLQPGFNEATLDDLNGPAIRLQRETFDRKKALNECPTSLVPIYSELFDEIDSLDLKLNLWDLAHNKRKTEPRPQLLAKFTSENISDFSEEISHWNQYKYLKMRHLLVELRRQQYTLKDSYTSKILRHTVPIFEQPPTPVQFESDIEVFPLGLNSEKNTVAPLIFRDEFDPNTYTENELNQISSYLWQKIERFDTLCARTTPDSTPSTLSTLSNTLDARDRALGGQDQAGAHNIIDFRELEHVYNIFLYFFDLEDGALRGDIESETYSLLKTLNYYISITNLTDIQREILELKIKKVKNQDIADYVNQKYEKSYTANYISTIFRQKIIKKINEAVAMHFEIIQNIFFPENFKRCSTCGQSLLINSDNFVKKSRSKDGYSSRCKRCDKSEREKKKKREEKIN